MSTRDKKKANNSFVTENSTIQRTKVREMYKKIVVLLIFFTMDFYLKIVKHIHQRIPKRREEHLRPNMVNT